MEWFLRSGYGAFCGSNSKDAEASRRVRLPTTFIAGLVAVFALALQTSSHYVRSSISSYLSSISAKGMSLLLSCVMCHSLSEEMKISCIVVALSPCPATLFLRRSRRAWEFSHPHVNVQPPVHGVRNGSRRTHRPEPSSLQFFLTTGDRGVGEGPLHSGGARMSRDAGGLLLIIILHGERDGHAALNHHAQAARLSGSVVEFRSQVLSVCTFDERNSAHKGQPFPTRDRGFVAEMRVSWLLAISDLLIYEAVQFVIESTRLQSTFLV